MSIYLLLVLELLFGLKRPLNSKNGSLLVLIPIELGNYTATGGRKCRITLHRK
jgi:hypothetical protein